MKIAATLRGFSRRLADARIRQLADEARDKTTVITTAQRAEPAATEPPR